MVKGLGHAISSERRLRKLSANLAGEMVPFTFTLWNWVDLRPAPLLYVPDLVGMIFEALDHNERYVQLQSALLEWTHCSACLQLGQTDVARSFHQVRCGSGVTRVGS